MRNVSPEELVNLPVNGRNFANLMTLAPGATSDGNGGWCVTASVPTQVVVDVSGWFG